MDCITQRFLCSIRTVSLCYILNKTLCTHSTNDINIVTVMCCKQTCRITSRTVLCKVADKEKNHRKTPPISIVGRSTKTIIRRQGMAMVGRVFLFFTTGHVSSLLMHFQV